MIVRRAERDDWPAALRVWRAANGARGVVPTRERAQRVAQKLAEPDSVVVVILIDGEVRGMVLAEPWRQDDGHGSIVSDRGHVSMVFVDPQYWGRGLGSALIGRLHDVAGYRGWTRLSLWTRESNRRAQRLYAAAGYVPTGRVAALEAVGAVMEFEAVLRRP